MEISAFDLHIISIPGRTVVSQRLHCSYLLFSYHRQQANLLVKPISQWPVEPRMNQVAHYLEPRICPLEDC
jgi:alkylhydroperoxidase family enzyme